MKMVRIWIAQLHQKIQIPIRVSGFFNAQMGLERAAPVRRLVQKYLAERIRIDALGYVFFDAEAISL